MRSTTLWRWNGKAVRVLAGLGLVEVEANTDGIECKLWDLNIVSPGPHNPGCVFKLWIDQRLLDEEPDSLNRRVGHHHVQLLGKTVPCSLQVVLILQPHPEFRRISEKA